MKGDAFFVEAASRPPFTALHPRVAAFFKEYLASEKVVRFRDRWVLNTHFPPFPSPAFDNLADHFNDVGDLATRRLYSVTLAVTNRCPFTCWHCYNAGRDQEDMPLDVVRRLAAELTDRSAVMVMLTGGEPLLRDDLETIAGLFDERTCLMLGTTGDGLTPERARRLADAGIFGVGVSLDSPDPAEHDRRRGREGAFDTARRALDVAAGAGLYPYVVSVATRDLLPRERMLSLLETARAWGALEVHLLEPSATGRLAEQPEVLLSAEERRRLVDYQHEVAVDESLPILSTFTYLESGRAFGCGAGLTHLYVDGNGEVCPCNLVPLSFGNVRDASLEEILGRMGEHFREPRVGCVGRLLGRHVPEGAVPAPRETSDRICAEHLPGKHAVPRFFEVRQAGLEDVGREDLRHAYDGVHAHYDEFWLTEAAGPIEDLVDRIEWTGEERVFEAGCGTGYGTGLCATRVASILAADLSEGMLEEARRRLRDARNVRFHHGDALALLGEHEHGPFDLVFTSWVLGYIPLRPFFESTARALAAGGRLAFVVHREHSPARETGLFAEIVAEDPDVLTKRVAFDFPSGSERVREEAAHAGLEVEDVWEGAITFRYETAQAVLDHLLKSGAGTAFHEAIDPARRPALTQEFLERLASRVDGGAFEVVHDYVGCVARRPA